MALDQLKAVEREARAKVEAQEQAALAARQEELRLQDQTQALRRQATEKLRAALRLQELRVFGYRLLLTLPLLVVAGWLFSKRRHTQQWPFVWGFIFFAGFTFFVELVPYLPEYGGYVRYSVGIILTLLIGRKAIGSLNRYLERQNITEQLPDLERRKELGYEEALARLGKGVCPGCERAVPLTLEGLDFCPHCGINLHNHCPRCAMRKSAFVRYCHACGADARAES